MTTFPLTAFLPAFSLAGLPHAGGLRTAVSFACAGSRDGKMTLGIHSSR